MQVNVWLVVGIALGLFVLVTLVDVETFYSPGGPPIKGTLGGSGGCIQVWTAEDLNNVRNNLAGHYCQMADIDLSEYSNWVPIGGFYNGFTGTYDGNYRKIRNLRISRDPYSSEHLGLFARIGDQSGASGTANIREVIIENVSIIGGYQIGALAGGAVYALISDSKVIGGKIEADGLAGGLFGQGGNFVINKSSVEDLIISNSSDCSFDCGASGMGGLIGAANSLNDEGVPFDHNIIIRSRVVGVLVQGGRQLGGLAGIFRGTIEESYVFITIRTTSEEVGGLVGHLDNSLVNTATQIRDSYSSGVVHDLSTNPFMANNTGGLIGEASIKPGRWTDIVINNSYSFTIMTPSNRAGGLIGKKIDSGEAIVNIISSYWDIDASGVTRSDGGTGKTTAQMKTQSTYQNWDFTTVWTMINGKTYPVLRSQFGLAQWARWPFESVYEKGGKTYSDEVTNVQKNDALVNGAEIAPGRVGKSLFFRRSEKDYVDSQSDFDLYNSFAISTWIRLQQAPPQGEYYVIMSKNKMPDEKSYAMFVDSNSKLYFVFYPTADGSSEVLVSTTINATVWNHVAVVYDGEKLALYVNGIKKGEKVAPGVRPADIQSNLIIGAQANRNEASGYSDYHWGSIDDVRMYHRPLLEDEITVLANGFS